MSDEKTTLDDLKRIVAEFVDERNWNQFHSPKNVAMSLAIEAAELMEHFQWLTTDESREVTTDAEKRRAVADELADVLCYALALANELGIDVADALQAKMVQNRRKYPVDEYRGRFGADDRRPPEAADSGDGTRK